MQITKKHVKVIALHPHVLGNLLGFEDLTEIHSDWIRYIWDTKESNSLQAHRGGYKTTAIAIIGMIRRWLFHPNNRIGYMRKNFTEAWKVAEVVVELIQKPEAQKFFRFVHGSPVEVVKKDKGGGIILFNFKTKSTVEGSLNVYGSSTGITGAHLDDFLGDDFVTIEDKNSKAKRERTVDIVQEVNTNIMDPGHPANWIGTPWHKNDAWKVLPKPLKYDWTTTGILTKEDIADKKMRTSKKMFAANYLLKHIADDDAIFFDMVSEPWDWTVRKSYAQIDSKFSGECTGAMTIGCIRRKDGRKQFTGRVFYNHIDEEMDQLIETMVRYRVKELHIERNADKGYVANKFSSIFNKRSIPIVVKDYDEKMNKHTKIVTYLKGSFPDILWTDDEGSEEYKSQILDYREGEKPDDCADSAASLERQVWGSEGLTKDTSALNRW